MIRFILPLSLVLSATTLLIAEAGGQQSRSAALEATTTSDESAPKGDDSVSRGKYLVHDVAMCIYCHTPKQDDGTLKMEQLLAGAPIPLQSPYAGQEWAFRAPSLRGLPGGWTSAEMIEFLQTGKTPSDHEIRLPMPPYQFNQEDAAAIVEYLKSLEKKTP